MMLELLILNMYGAIKLEGTLECLKSDFNKVPLALKDFDLRLSSHSLNKGIEMRMSISRYPRMNFIMYYTTSDSITTNQLNYHLQLFHTLQKLPFFYYEVYCLDMQTSKEIHLIIKKNMKMPQ